jgi:hypothetical protein
MNPMGYLLERSVPIVYAMPEFYELFEEEGSQHVLLETLSQDTTKILNKGHKRRSFTAAMGLAGMMSPSKSGSALVAATKTSPTKALPTKK